MTSRRWGRQNTQRKQNTRSPRPVGSWSVALDQARREWDALAAPPLIAGRYSDTAAAAILSLAVALWPQVAAAMEAEDADGV